MFVVTVAAPPPPSHRATCVRLSLLFVTVPELALLRAQFEEDKERIKRLQAARPFKPHR